MMKDQSTSPSYIEQTATSLVQARLAARPLSDFPGIVPENLEAAYAVQAAAIRKWPDKLAGFKVGGIPEKFRKQFPAEWLAGPVFSNRVLRSLPGQLIDFPVYDGGFAAFEPELIFVIDSQAFKLSEKWTADAARSVIETIYLGAEIASSPNINVNNLGPGSIISDFGNNGGCILGYEVEKSRLDKALTLVVETLIDGESVGKTRPQTPPGGPLGALAFLLNQLNLKHELYDLPGKIFVSSGAITGVHQSEVGSVGELLYEKLEALNIRFVTQQPELV